MYFDNIQEAAEFISETFDLNYTEALNFVVEESCDVQGRTGLVLYPAIITSRLR